MKDEIKNTAASAADEAKAGYKRPPVKNRFPKGKSGNPFGRRKGQRSLATVLKEVLQQTVKVKQADRSERLTKGEALIKVILSKANNGDRRAIDAVSYLAEKIGRIEDKNSETSQVGGVMLVPGVAASAEEWKKAMAKKGAEQEERARLRKEDARTLRRYEAGWLAYISEHKGTTLGDFAVTQLAKMKNSDRYRTNYFLHWYPEEIEATFPKKKNLLRNCRGTGTSMPGHQPTQGRSISALIPKREAQFQPQMAPQLFTAIPANLTFGVQYRFQSYLPTTRARPGEMPGGEPEK